MSSRHLLLNADSFFTHSSTLSTPVTYDLDTEVFSVAASQGLTSNTYEDLSSIAPSRKQSRRDTAIYVGPPQAAERRDTLMGHDRRDTLMGYDLRDTLMGNDRRDT